MGLGLDNSGLDSLVSMKSRDKNILGPGNPFPVSDADTFPVYADVEQHPVESDLTFFARSSFCQGSDDCEFLEDFNISIWEMQMRLIIEYFHKARIWRLFHSQN